MLTVLTHRWLPDGTALMVATSVEDSRVPPVKDKVRATIKLAGWRFVSKAGGVEVSYAAPRRQPVPGLPLMA